MENSETSHLTYTKSVSLWRAFRHRNFSLFFWGQTISMIGTWSQVLAMSWLVWRMTKSPMWLGVAGFASQIPMLFFGLIGGAVADKYDRLKILTLMQVLCMLQAIAIGILTLTGKVQIWHIIALSILLGVVYSFEFPVRQSFVTDMVGKHDLLNAVSLVSAMFHASRILGPVAAGFIVAWKGEGVCFLFNAASFLFLIAALGLIDRKTLISPQRSNISIKHSILEGLKYMWSRGDVKLALVLVMIMSGVGLQFATLMPIFADDIYKGGALNLGWLMGAGGFGALLGALWLAARKSSEKLLSLSAKASLIFSLMLLIFSQATNLLIALVALAFAGFFLTITFASVNTLLQHATPDHLRGRMMSLFTMTFVGLSPFGSLLVGFMAKAIGAPLTLTVCAGICFVAAVFILGAAKKVKQETSRIEA